MKKLLTLLAVVGCAGILTGANYIDKINIENLNYRALNAGQVAWNHEDGAGVLYIGSPTEAKTLRFIDPTALRGYRYKDVTSELTVNSSENVVNTEAGVWKWTYDASAPYEIEYASTDKHTVDLAKDPGSWIVGYATKNADGTFTDTTPEDGSTIITTNSNIYLKKKYISAKVHVISKDSLIQELDFLYTQREAAALDGGDYVRTTRTITYDERIATIDFKITFARAGAYFQVQDFKAKCLGVGDVVHVNDLAVNKIFIYDSLTDKNGRTSAGGRKFLGNAPKPGFDLYKLREWAENRWNGNRGEHWSKYAATNNVNMKTYFMQWTCPGITNGANPRVYSHGVVDTSVIWNYNGNAFMEYRPAPYDPDELAGTVYEDLEIRFTAINNPKKASEIDGAYFEDNWTLEFITSKEIPDGIVEVQWYANEKGFAQPHLWTTIPLAVGENSLYRIATSGTTVTYRAVLPTAYTDNAFNCGFFRIKVDPFPQKNKVIIRAGVRVIGADGNMYDLEWPDGGGAVTAKLAEDDDTTN